MYPTINIVGHDMPAFALFQALGISLALIIINRRLRDRAVGKTRAFFYIAIFVAIFWIGGRLGDAIFYGGDFDMMPGRDNGSSMLGSMLMVSLALPLFSSLMRNDWRDIADAFVLPLAIAQISGKIGCFFAGCCYGTVSDLPWAVDRHIQTSALKHAVLVHPVQIYEAVGYLLVLLLVVQSRYIRALPGRASSLYLIGYGVVRFLSEFLRHDAIELPYGLSLGQSVALLLIFLGGVSLGFLYLRRFRNSRVAYST